MNDADLAKLCADVGQNFGRLKKKLGLDHYSEQLMEQNNGIDDVYRYDIESRSLFVEVHVETGVVNRAFFVK